LEVDDDEMIRLSGLAEFMRPIEHANRKLILKRERNLDKKRLAKHKYDPRMIELLSLSS
jgi:hypothetical protein